MVRPEVSPEHFPAIVTLLTALHVALPHLQHMMLRVFMTFPVILTPEPLVAVRHGTTIWLLMSFLVFPMTSVSIISEQSDKK